MPHLDYLPDRMGHAAIAPSGPFEAGSHATLTYTYTAGLFGIDDTGGIKICFRATSDMGKPQLTDPRAPNYVTVRASNGVALHTLFDVRLNVRPWPQTLFIRTQSGFLRAGDQIVVVFGDRSGGSPGLRLQTNVEDSFEFRTLVDALATYEFVQLPQSPEVALVAGPAASYRVVLPTERALADPVRLSVTPCDRWGNPAAFPAAAMHLAAEPPLAGLPAMIQPATQAGQPKPLVCDGLRPGQAGDHRVRLLDADGRVVATSNPMRIVPAMTRRPYWADMHGQSEETIGTNSADAYFRFARDRAFLDIAGHQGNDFQITPAFWQTLNRLTAEFNVPGQFVTLPGYEWSGNTGMGGDRNVFWAQEGQPIHRSSRVLTMDMPAGERDCHQVSELFQALAGQDVVMVAHVGGRYADLAAGHDGRLETAVEVHSSWGTFEWLLHDAFDLGFRAGVVCNSDDHKGRQGATSPGASQFGAIGGLTCLLLPRLDRAAVFAALRSRRHYGTTGCRMLMHVTAALPDDAAVFDQDPALFPGAQPVASPHALMGHIVRTAAADVTFEFDVVGAAPVDRVDVFNGRDHLASYRGFDDLAGSRRIRVMWEGAEYRGRGRQTKWDGTAELTGNRIGAAAAVNFLNADNPLVRDGNRLAWRSVTTGNMAGFDAVLEDAAAGELTVVTPHATVTVAVRDIGPQDIVTEAGGLGRRLRIFRLPEGGGQAAIAASLRVALQPGRDNPVFIRVTQEDGHQAWSSPIYFIP